MEAGRHIQEGMTAWQGRQGVRAKSKRQTLSQITSPSRHVSRVTVHSSRPGWSAINTELAVLVRKLQVCKKKSPILCSFALGICRIWSINNRAITMVQERALTSTFCQIRSFMKATRWSGRRQGPFIILMVSWNWVCFLGTHKSWITGDHNYRGWSTRISRSFTTRSNPDCYSDWPLHVLVAFVIIGNSWDLEIRLLWGFKGRVRLHRIRNFLSKHHRSPRTLTITCPRTNNLKPGGPSLDATYHRLPCTPSRLVHHLLTQTSSRSYCPFRHL